jgi:hypothetical protein
MLITLLFWKMCSHFILFFSNKLKFISQSIKLLSHLSVSIVNTFLDIKTGFVVKNICTVDYIYELPIVDVISIK